MVLRMPSQSVAPLKALGLRKCPSCTTSTQPPDDRLMLYRPALGAVLMLAKPAKVPSLGARSGGIGSLASVGLRRARITACEGRAASSAPDASVRRSGAVSAARSRSIPHLNLSQPLGSSAAQAGAAPSNASVTRSDVRMSVDRNHDVGSFHHDSRLPAGLDAEVVDRLVGDRGGDDLAVADIDADMGRGCALLHFDDGTLDLVACTDAHDESFKFPRTCTTARIDK